MQHVSREVNPKDPQTPSLVKKVSQSHLDEKSTNYSQNALEDGFVGSGSNRVSADEPRLQDISSPIIEYDEPTFPEGGLQAWLVVLGSFCGFMASLGIANSLGAFHAYIAANQLKDYDEGAIGWLFSIYAFLSFFCGIYIGPLFDKYGPRYLILPGSCCLVLCMMLLGLCVQYWHFILVFGVLGGVGTALMFTPCVAAIGHFFNVRRGTAMGIGQTGGAFGGICYPFMLDGLIPKIGWAWATRTIGFVILVLCIITNLLVRTRLPPDKDASANPDLRILKNLKFALTVAGVFLLEWALFVPMTYISSYALKQGFSDSFSFQILAIINAASIFGRWLPGYFGDHIGRYNACMMAVSITVIGVLAVWLPAGGTTPGIVLFAILFGFGSGSNISLTPVCIGQLCKIENYGRYHATCYSIVSIGCLTGIPIAGQIIQAAGGEYWGLIVFVGVCYFCSLLAFAAVKVLAVGWKFKAIF